MSDEFFSFDEALNELRLKEEELKRLVSEGEIRAFRKGETMKLRRSDVESLRSELQGGEVVDLGEDLVEELVFEEEPAAEPVGMATEAISDLDTILEDPLDDAPAPEITQVIDEDLELEEVLDDDLEEAMPLVAGASMGTGRIVQDDVDDEMISAGFLAAVLVATVLMIMVIPIAYSLTTGRASTMAKTIAGMFTDMPQ
ncbi:MAG: hypothetical protein GY930_19815 [bacterium]|nr:hypothetical protein [bacterium]